MNDKAIYALSRSEGNQWDFFDKNGNQLIANKYSSIRLFDEEDGKLLFMVESNGKWGLINDELKEIISCVYDKIELSGNDKYTLFEYYASAEKDGKLFDMDYRGNIFSKNGDLFDEAEDDFI